MAGVTVLMLGEATMPGSSTALAASYSPSMEKAIIRRPADGVCWWLRGGVRRWIPDGTTYMAISIDNGGRSYNWTDRQIDGIPEGQAVPSRIPTGRRAADWALGRVGMDMDIGYCLRFCSRAYGETSSGKASAILAWEAWGRASDFPTGEQLLPGMLVYFDAMAENGYDGHAGIYIGDGTFVSATDNGVKRETVSDWDSHAPYLGYSEAPYPLWRGL